MRIAKYHANNRAFPQRLEALVRAGSLQYVPSDPSGTPYQYDPQAGEVRLNPRSKVRYLEVPRAYKQVYLEKLAGSLSEN